MDRVQRWIADRDGLRPEMDPVRRWIMAGNGSQWIWMNDRRWMTGDGSRERDHGRRMTVNLLPYMKILRLCEVIPFSRSLRYHATKLQSGAEMQPYDFPVAWLHAPVPMPNTIPNQIPSHNSNADTALAVRDQSLAEQRFLTRGMTVPESQQPLPRIITIPEMQERSTVKRIH